MARPRSCSSLVALGALAALAELAALTRRRVVPSLFLACALVLVACSSDTSSTGDEGIPPIFTVQEPPGMSPAPRSPPTAPPIPTQSLPAKPGEATAVTSQYELRNDMRRLWTEHVAYTRFYVVEATGGLPGAAKTSERLLANAAAIGRAFEPFYGEDGRNQLGELLTEHVDGAVALVLAMKAGDDVKVELARDAWYLNADRISRLLVNANPNLVYANIQPMMRMNLDQTLAQATARLGSDWKADVEAFDVAIDHVLELADTLAAALGKQFPALVSPSFFVSRADVHFAERKLWEDHALWMRVFLVDAAGGTSDIETTTARLLANQDQIGDTIRPFYGDEAATQLAKLLHDHVTGAADLVAATRSRDDARIVAAKDRWYANADAIADLLATANPRFGELRAMLHAHLDQTLAEATHQLSGDYETAIGDYDVVVRHILQMSDTMSDVLAAQFPDTRR